MKTILAIDFGLKKVGLAIATSSLSEPLSVLRYEDINILVRQIKQICEKEKVEKIVVGVSDGDIAEKSKNLGLSLGETLNIPVEYLDETLTTQDAQRMAIEAGVKRQKRKNMEDAFAAAVMLQSYLDS